MQKTILLLLSNSCNLNCKYCYEKFKDSRKMSWDTALRILQHEFIDTEEEVGKVDLLGGEPLTNFAIIPQICDWIWSIKPSLKISARTNGSLLTDEMKLWFKENNARFTLGLSIDGTPDVNYFNRGVGNIDFTFFKKNWPEQALKMTIFPDSVSRLYDSLLYFYDMGFRVIGGLAQGVIWDKKSCENLQIQMENLSYYYLKNPHVTPLSELYNLNFNHAFSKPNRNMAPCWKRSNIHAYDYKGNQFPCHMFSPIVQGEIKSKEMLADSCNISQELIPIVCQECPICWSCKKCMGLNYQHTGHFEQNINCEMMCQAQKVTAIASAKLLLSMVAHDVLNIDSEDMKLSVSNAIKYLRLMNEINYE